MAWTYRPLKELSSGFQVRMHAVLQLVQRTVNLHKAISADRALNADVSVTDIITPSGVDQQPQ